MTGVTKQKKRLKPRPTGVQTVVDDDFVEAVERRMEEKPKKVPKTLSLTADHYERLERWCIQEGKTPSFVVDHLVGEFLRRKGV